MGGTIVDNDFYDNTVTTNNRILVIDFFINRFSGYYVSRFYSSVSYLCIYIATMEQWTYADSLVEYLNPQLKLPLHIIVTNEEVEFFSLMSRLQNIEQAFEVIRKLNLPDKSNAKRIDLLRHQIMKDEEHKYIAQFKAIYDWNRPFANH
jgi:hypothetical protein